MEGAEKRILKKRRRKKKADSAGHAWELESKGSRSSRSEKRQMRLMLIRRRDVVRVDVAGVMVFMNRGAKTVVRSGEMVVARVVAAKMPEKTAARSEASRAAEANLWPVNS